MIQKILKFISKISVVIKFVKNVFSKKEEINGKKSKLK